MKKSKKKLILITTTLTLTLFLISLSSAALALTGKEIMQNVNDRETGKSSASKTKMVIVNNKGQERVRTIQAIRKEYGDLNKTMIRFLAPADVKGTGFLVWENANKDDDQFLYMPATGKVRRITSSSKSERFMGTEFTYEDMENRKVEKDTHKLLGEETIDGKKCYKVESIPKDGADSQYSKFVSWVRADIWVPVKIEFYDDSGALLKVLTVKKIEKIDNIWTTTDTEMHNVQKDWKTLLTIEEIKYNLGNIKDDYFTERFLKQG
jgi:outer membrane lipoprotein-sorting protein